MKATHRLIWTGFVLTAATGLGVAAPPPPAPVPQTGQTHVHRTGDDGSHRVGIPWPTPRFISHDDGTVTDLLTGLMWTRDANPGGNRNWNAAVDYCRNLVFSEYDDWRLPNAHEMVTLLVGATTPRYVGPHGGVFSNVQNSYWQSTVRPDGGAYFYFDNAGPFTHAGAGAAAVLPVWPVRDGLDKAPAMVAQTGQTNVYRAGADGDLRKGVAWPEPRFRNNQDGTVTDNLTGLMWMRNANHAGSETTPTTIDEIPPPPVGGNMNWYIAIDYCNDLEWAGHTDWRLPNLLELLSLQHWGSANPTSGHGLFWYVEFRYWSSTSYALNEAYFVHGLTVGAGKLDKNTSASMYVWPVRGPETIPVTGLTVIVH